MDITETIVCRSHNEHIFRALFTLNRKSNDLFNLPISFLTLERRKFLIKYTCGNGLNVCGVYIVESKTLEVELLLINSSTYICIFSFKSSINSKMDDQFFTPAIVFYMCSGRTSFEWVKWVKMVLWSSKLLFNISNCKTNSTLGTHESVHDFIECKCNIVEWLFGIRRHRHHRCYIWFGYVNDRQQNYQAFYRSALKFAQFSITIHQK